MTAKELIKVLSRADECCPPLECPGEGAKCDDCWAGYVESLGLNLDRE